MLQDRRFHRDEIKAGRARRFAAQMSDCLYELEITHKALAQELGVSVHTIDAWTRAVDPNVPGEANLNRLCDLLERKRPGAGVQVAKSVGHNWKAPIAEPVQLHAVVGPPPTNLPPQLSSFIGREAQMVRAARLLKEARLLTLTGSGGTGKTRFSLQLASETLEEFPDGVWFVELAALTDHKLLIPTTASALGVKEVSGESLLDTLKRYLLSKQLLLILDNFEQVLPASIDVVVLLAECPQLKVLVTSRAPLRVRGEHEFPVPPLSLPDTRHVASPERLTQYEAVRLFSERATEVKPDFEVTADNAHAVAEVCVRLDGLPLAIELAAARIRLFSPQALLTRLSKRLSVLTGGATDLPARHQTLRNTIAWSYDLLSEGEKQLFRRMAIFQGGTTLEGIEAVCNSESLQSEGPLQLGVLEGVEFLVSKSLLQQKEGSDGEPLFWMLETLQEFAREELGESREKEALQREHASHFMKLAEEAEPELTGAEQQKWLNRLEDEHDNLRTALRWARENGSPKAAEIGLRLAGVLWRFWSTLGYLSEGREQLAGALDVGLRSSELRPEGQVPPGNSTMSIGAGFPAQDRKRYLSLRRQTPDLGPSFARALNGAGILAWLQGDYDVARSLHEESLALRRELGDKSGVATSLNNLGLVADNQGNFTDAYFLYEESLAIRRELGDMRGIAATLNNLGRVAGNQENYTAARALYAESLAIWRELGNPNGVGASLNNLGTVADNQGDYVAAHSLYEESLGVWRGLGDKLNIAWSLTNLGKMAHQEQNVERALELYSEGLVLSRETGDKPRIAVCLVGLAGVAIQQGQGEKGAKLLGGGDGLLETMGAVVDRGEQQSYDDVRSRLLALLGKEAFERAMQEGRTMSIDQVVEYALRGTGDK